MAQDVCKIDGCEKGGPFRRGMCNMHRNRVDRHGSPDGGTPSYVWPENLLRRLRFMPDGCIEFTGAVQGSGYGYLRIDGGNALAHRRSYELCVGPIPDGLVIDHLCSNRICVNPGHLEPVTQLENVRRAHERAAERTAA